MPTIRYEQEGQQVGCIEGANLRRATLDSGLTPYKGLNNPTAVGLAVRHLRDGGCPVSIIFRRG